MLVKNTMGWDTTYLWMDWFDEWLTMQKLKCHPPEAAAKKTGY